jgi:hypothetical protein
MGRPSIDPELMIRMLVVGYVFAIRSERLLCREEQIHAAAITWFVWPCRWLGVADARICQRHDGISGQSGVNLLARRQIFRLQENTRG